MARTRVSHLLLGLALSAGLALSVSCVQQAGITQPSTNPANTAGNVAAPDLGEVYQQRVTLTDETEDPAEWGKNYPYHYADFKLTAQMGATKYGGSRETANTTGVATDSRTVVAQSKIDEDPGLKQMWTNMPFGVDFREERGHAYMLTDQVYTKRQNGKQVGACINCHGSTYVAFKKIGNGDLTKGFETLNPQYYFAAKDNATHPITHAVACIDCHNPADMKLRVTRPGLIEGLKALKATQGVQNYDVNASATQAEMKNYTCAQCHVEYYFKGTEKRLVFPWQNGLTVDNAYDYYQSVNFSDWTMVKTGSPLLKAQHPEYETYMQGKHGKAGVTCVDCHMGKKTVKGQQITDHHIESPIITDAKIDQTCTKCHSGRSPADSRALVVNYQDNTKVVRDQTMAALRATITAIEAASASAGGTVSAEVLALHRKGQFYFDYAEAENSGGFHAPTETARILGASLTALNQAKALLPQ